MVTGDTMKTDSQLKQPSFEPQVFSNVTATLSPEITSCLPEQKQLYLQEQLSMMELLINCENNTYFVSGHLAEVNKCCNKLSRLLDCESRNLNEEVGAALESDWGNTHTGLVTVDSGVNCELIKPIQSNSSTSKPITELQISTSKKRPSIAVGLTGDAEPDAGTFDAVDNYVPTSFTKRGRVIKRPKRFIDSLLSETNGEDIADDDHRPVVTNQALVPVAKPLVVSRQNTLQAPIKDETNDNAPMEWIKSMRNVAREKLNRKNMESVPEANDSDVYPNVCLKATSTEAANSETNSRKMRKGQAQSEAQLMRQYYEKKLPFKYYCAKCSFKCKRESHYQKHVNLHNNNPSLQILVCDKCDFTTIRKSVLNMHELKHAAKDLMACRECKYSTNDKQKLKRHIKNKHTVRLPDTEQRSMPRNIDSDPVAESIKKDEANAKYECNLCGYTTTRKEHMVRHKSDVHTNIRPHLCDTCGASFKRVDALRQHKDTHMDKSTRKKPYTCFHCKKCFKSQAHMKEHMPVHSKLRAHLCDICGAAFKTRAVQKKHQQTIHFNPGSHRCGSCPKGFNTKYALQRHARVHDFEPQVAEVMDENATAIQTITIAADQLPQFTQHLQSMSQQLQSASDIGEVYIQGGVVGGGNYIPGEELQISQGEELQINAQGAGLQYYITSDGIPDHAIVQIDGQQLVDGQGHTLIEHGDQDQALIEQVEGQTLMDQTEPPTFTIQVDHGQTLLTLKTSDVENL